ncbi:hypothetical protein QTQ03_29860 [Micromonospora sp. WMMA1363]|uniref:hypothetical protein n=1 Tax=Micromonospora sp. WMMA1363 TaxID=3053985 RepID=UPI00259CD696|nr:hypothetical protein [Micromonospora sp. WMMA1363]MDM4723574.1 hypothetical protein [Micromonospora sp. WMMA1363]
MVDFLSGEHAAGMTHAELEEALHTDGMRLLCQLLQDSLIFVPVGRNGSTR